MLVFRRSRDADPLLAALDKVHCPVFVVEKQDDGGFQIVHLNGYFHDRTGLDPATICSGPIDQVFPVRMAASLAKKYRAALAQDGTASSDEMYHLNGTDSWWRTTLSRAPASPKGRERLIGLAVEISDAKACEFSLTADITALRSAYAHVQNVTGLTVLDMRTPLQNVISMVEIVLDGFKDLGDGKRDLIAACREVASASVDTLDAMLERVNQEDPHRERNEFVHLDAVCRSLAGLVDPGKMLDIRYPSARLWTDPVILHTCLRHLMDNAARHAGSSIQVDLNDHPTAGRVILQVTDDGPGVAPDTDPVAQAEAAAETPGAITTGLASVLRLVAGRGGALRHRRPPNGTGALFELTIPGEISEDAAPPLSG